jgi:hypothetical protein
MHLLVVCLLTRTNLNLLLLERFLRLLQPERGFVEAAIHTLNLVVRLLDLLVTLRQQLVHVLLVLLFLELVGLLVLTEDLCYHLLLVALELYHPLCIEGVLLLHGCYYEVLAS